VKRATRIVETSEWDGATAVDRVLLDADERHRRRIVLTGERGTTFLLDLARPAVLRDGDGLVLDDERVVRVVGKPEPLIEIAASDAHELARLAWHLGNRHTDVQVIGDRLRIRRDHVLEEMLVRLGARLTPIEAPFEPERGAYEHHAHDHAHAHDHDHHHGE
jgi:urease accessory protein